MSLGQAELEHFEAFEGLWLAEVEVQALVGIEPGVGIFRGRRSTDSSVLAVRISPDGGSPTLRASFLRREDLIARLDHPNCARGSGPRTKVGFVYALRPWMPGLQPLSSVWDDLRPGWAVALSLQILEAIEHVHERGILLRDVSPGSFEVDRSVSPPRLVCTGFAAASEVARKASRDTMAELMAGRPEFMSPEQRSGRRLDRRSDLFAAGSVLTKLWQHEATGPSAAVARLLARMTDPDPHARFEAAEEVLEAFERALAEPEPDAPRQASPAEPWASPLEASGRPLTPARPSSSPLETSPGSGQATRTRPGRSSRIRRVS